MAFDWSQLSAGSLLLAQALLDDAAAKANYGRVVRRFQRDVVAAMPRERFVTTDAEIRSWRAGASCP